MIQIACRTRKNVLDRGIIGLIAILFLNYSTLSSANCKSFCNLNKMFDHAYTELVVLEDDSGETVVLPDSFCEVDTGSDDGSEDDDSSACDNCPYCHACNIGMTFQHVPPLILAQIIVSHTKIFNKGRSFVNKQITLNHPQRAPPFPV